jgi:acyl-homoserine-lactone acylase
MNLSRCSLPSLIRHLLPFTLSLLVYASGHSSDSVEQDEHPQNPSDSILFSSKEIKQFRATASQVTIIRDNWGVPHIYAATDQQCAFGLMYAQCEDNFWQVEETMIRQLGRAAELYGESELGNDIQVALFECVQRAKAAYQNASAIIRSSCIAAANGINFYIYSNPSKLRLLTRYEPWFFLLPSPDMPGHGITRNEIRNALPGLPPSNRSAEGEEDFLIQQNGSNALAIAAAKAIDAKSILVINPHVGFFGDGQRYEAHLVSRQGMNVSGFAILGTFYIWSGFTERTAWAHTNTGADYQDVYLEKPDLSDSSAYTYNGSSRKLVSWQDSIHYRSGDSLAYKVFNFRKTHHGPVVAIKDGSPVTTRSVLDDDPAGYILQSLRMCKARSLKEFEQAMSLCQLATNTMYSDRNGNIAYWHGSRIPVRDTSFDWTQPVDGSIQQTEWKGYHTSQQTIHYINPASGFLQNCNSTPFLAVGETASKDPSLFPTYMGDDEQTLRSQEMLYRISLKDRLSAQDVASVITSRNLPLMRNWLDQIIVDYKRTADEQPGIKPLLETVVDTLSKWNYQYSPGSTATTLAFDWYTEYASWLRRQSMSRREMIDRNVSPVLMTPPGVATQFLVAAVKDLTQLYGTPFVEWQSVCRLQRVHTSGKEKFDDSKPSIPVNAAPGNMGSLFAFNLRFDPASKKGYGASGNTYVAIVAFGKKLNAKSIVTFGQSSDSLSAHYFDQATLYAKGSFKEALYYKKDILRNAEVIYHPGEHANMIEK